MKKKNIFSHLAQAGLAFAIAALIGMGLMSCNKEKNKPGPEPKKEGIIMTTEKNIGDDITLKFHKDDAPVVEGATKNGEEAIEGEWKKQTYTLKAKNITIKGKVTWLDCSRCGLNSLDVSNNRGLTNLDCGYNTIQTLDVSKNTKLTELSCYGCGLNSLDVSKNEELTILRCGNNNLESLDVSKNLEIKIIYCSRNKLTRASLNLPNRTGKEEGKLNFRDSYTKGETQVLYKSVVKELKNNLNWKAYHYVKQKGSFPQWVEYEGIEILPG